MTKTRFLFLLRRWYWTQPYHTRWAVSRLPTWLAAVGAGVGLAYLLAQGVR